MYPSPFRNSGVLEVPNLSYLGNCFSAPNRNWGLVPSYGKKATFAKLVQSRVMVD